MSNMWLQDLLDLTINKEAQEIENVALDIMNQFDLNNSGATQDKIGALINCERKGLSQEDYAIKIKAFIAAANSSGRHNEILNALKLITQAVRVGYIYSKRGVVSLFTDGTVSPFMVDNLREFIEQCLGAGIGLDNIVYGGDDNSFTFDNLAGTITVGKGFGNLAGTADGGTLTYFLI